MYHVGGFSCPRSRGAPAPVEYGPGLDPNIFGGPRPVVPARDDGVLRRLVAQIDTGGRDLRDRDGHRGVIGPFARLPRPAAGHLHGQLGSARRLELVRRTQGIAGGGTQQDTFGSIIA